MKALKYLSFVGKVAGLVSALILNDQVVSRNHDAWP
jgi:hypothetical protein